MATLNLTAPKLDFKVDKGHDFDPILWVLDENNAPINLTGYTGNMQIKTDYADVTPLFNLTVANAGLTITGPSTITVKAGNSLNGVELLVDTVIAGVYGLQPHISATLMSAIVLNDLVHYVDLIEPGGRILPYAKGKIKLNPDGTS